MMMTLRRLSALRALAYEPHANQASLRQLTAALRQRQHERGSSKLARRLQRKHRRGRAGAF